jgi:hypothetical protein
VTGNMIDGYIAHDPDKTHVLAVSVAARSIPTPKELTDSAGTPPGSSRRQIDPLTDEP